MAVGQLTHLATDATDTVKSASNLTIPNDGSVIVGDLLIWCITIDSGSATRSFTTTGISGSTQLTNVVFSGHRSSVWYKVAEVSDLGATITVNVLDSSGPPGIRQVAALSKISGVDPTTPLGVPDKYAGWAQGDGGAVIKVTPPVSDIGSDCREIHIVFDNQNGAGNTTNWTAPTGFTRRGQGHTPTPTAQNCSFAWGDSDALVSGNAAGGTWTADDAAIGAAWTLVVYPEVSGSALVENVADTEGLTDTVGFVSVQTDSIADAEGVTDALSLLSVQTDTFGESLGLTDSLSLVLAAVEDETFSDTLGLTDSVSLVSVEPPPAPTYGDTLVMGPARIFIGGFGAPEPEGLDILNDPAAEFWTDVGATRGGLQITVEQEYKVIEVRQISTAPARRLERRKVNARTELAEPTLQNLLYVLNSGTMATGAGYASYSAPPEINEATPLEYRAVLIYGWAPGMTNGVQKRRAVILRKCISSEGTTVKYGKEDQTILAAQWTVHYVDSTTPTFRIIDEA